MLRPLGFGDRCEGHNKGTICAAGSAAESPRGEAGALGTPRDSMVVVQVVAGSSPSLTPQKAPLTRGFLIGG